MMHHVPQAGLTALAVAGPVERVVRPHRADAELWKAQSCDRAWRALEVAEELSLDAEAELTIECARWGIA
jgi:hypothetical protein